MQPLNCFAGKFSLLPLRLIFQQSPEKPKETPKPQGEKKELRPVEETGRKAIGEAYRKLEALQADKPAQEKLYKDRLVKFVGALREGTAHNYGFGQIVDGFFGEKLPKGVVMVDAEEKLLTQEDRNKIAQQVIKETGLTKQEAQPLLEKAAKKAREEAAKAKEERI